MRYADDTVVFGSCPNDVQRHFDSITKVRRQYGLELNLDKTELLRVRGHEDILGTEGRPLKSKDETVYLGGLVATNGRPTRELTRRSGEAKQVFNKLTQVWKHASISHRRKCEIFESCVVAKLLYGLESLLLLLADRGKLDAFQAQCLRTILEIPHSYYSRISNEEVLCKANARQL